MKNILILGAGKSATVLIEYMLDNAERYDWFITLGDLDEDLAKMKINKHTRAKGVFFNSEIDDVRERCIKNSDIIVSLLPASLHITVAEDCVKYKKHFVCASYVSEEMASLNDKAKAAGIILLNEMGLDPGIDHMSAKKMIDAIQEVGGNITTFESYTGGLIAPESDNNPWNYKFTWNPRNVVLAGQGTAKFLWNHQFKYIPYSKLFSRYDIFDIPQFGTFEGYPNRNSLAYRKTYGLEDAETIVRGTLRKRGFCDAWNVFVQLGMTDDSYIMEGVDDYTWKDYTSSFLKAGIEEPLLNLMNYLELGENKEIEEKLTWLGLFTDERIFDEDVNNQQFTPAQILQKLLEEKWKLEKTDKDLCVMLHLMEYELKNKKYCVQSSMVSIGEDSLHTAMAKTVGLPAAIATKMILNGTIKTTGVVIPVLPEIYNPVLQELKLQHGIIFEEIIEVKS